LSCCHFNQLEKWGMVDAMKSGQFCEGEHQQGAREMNAGKCTALVCNLIPFASAQLKTPPESPSMI
jgi:hypothetical protein